jgi:hypothetical protein
MLLRKDGRFIPVGLMSKPKTRITMKRPVKFTGILIAKWLHVIDAQVEVQERRVIAGTSRPRDGNRYMLKRR